MTLPSGTSIGPYKVLALVGTGGMGEVYRAVDPRLGREVAIKLLPAGFSSDSERVQRFSLEARAASALNHPNILTIFDVGAEGGSPYLVSELLEGKSLRELLDEHGQLPLRKAIDIAVQVANGLAVAHEKGILHRDLKPENLFVCEDGRVKILDFGLAKLTEKVRAGAQQQGATLSSATDPGTVLGTVGYMSPEQVRGQAADNRSDIFSLGTVLYEMLAGKRAFAGGSAADVSSAILKEDPPDVSASNAKVSPAMERIIQHCLEKVPSERFQSAKDLGFALRSISSGSEINPAAAKAGEPALSRTRALAFGLPLVFLALAGAAWLGHHLASRNQSQRVVRTQRLTDFVGLEEFPAVSPDGKSLVFVSDKDGTRQLWIRLLSGGVPLQITHDPVDHLYPRWSRDSASVIYYTPPASREPQGKLWETSSLGGFPRQIADSISGADVDHGGTRLAFFQLEQGKIKLISMARDGGDTRVIFQAAFNSEQPNFGYSYPRWSPDDKWIAYQHASAMWADDLYVVASASGSPRQVTFESKLMSGLAWTNDGSIVYSSAQETTVLYLPPMQLWMVKPDGSAARQLTYEDAVYEHPDVSGATIIASHRQMRFDLWKFPVGPDPVKNVAEGTRVIEQSGGVFTPTVSPDDSEIAFLSDSGGHGNIWVKNLRNGDLRQVTFERDPRNTIGTPVWSPVSQEIAFATTYKMAGWANVGYSVLNSDGSNLHTVVPTGAWAAWSGDGRYFYYSEALPTKAAQSNRLLKISSGGGTPAVVRNEDASGPAPAFDGSCVYYIVALENLNGGLDFELRQAKPENAPAKTLARISSTRVPQWQGLHPALSRDDRWLALPLNDQYGTNIWLISTADGSFRQLTNFGKQRTFIARRVSWSSDSRFIFAAVGVGQEDIVMLDGLLEPAKTSD